MERTIVSVLIGISLFFMISSFVRIETLFTFINSFNFALVFGIIFGITAASVLYLSLPRD